MVTFLLAHIRSARPLFLGEIPTLYELARRHLSEEESIDATLAIAAMNGWNHLAISFRTVPATYNAGQSKAGEDDAHGKAAGREAE